MPALGLGYPATTPASGCCSPSALFHTRWHVQNRCCPAPPRPWPASGADPGAGPGPSAGGTGGARHRPPHPRPCPGSARGRAPAHGDQVPPLHRSVAGAQALLAAAAAPAQARQAPGGHGGLAPRPLCLQRPRKRRAPASRGLPSAGHPCPLREGGSGAWKALGAPRLHAPARAAARTQAHAPQAHAAHTQARTHGPPPPSRARRRRRPPGERVRVPGPAAALLP